MVDHIEGVSNEDVASKIMALQTSLQLVADHGAAAQDEPENYI